MKMHLTRTFRRTALLSLCALGPLMLNAPAHAASVPSQQEEQGEPLPAATPLDALKAADVLESARIGFTGAISPQLLLLQQLLRDPDAKAQLEELYRDGSLAAKMYALIGLQMLGEEGLSDALLHDAASWGDKSLRVLEGCVLSELALADVLERIGSHSYSESFAAIQAREG